MKIRRARREDLPAVLALFADLARHQRAWRVFPPREGFQEAMVHRYRDAIDDPMSVLAVAEDGAEVVGMAMGQLNRPSSFSDEMAVEMSSVVVRPSHRGRGVARALTAEVARFAGRSGATRVTLKTFAGNADALRVWERLGFKPRIVQMTATVEDLTSDGGPGGDAPAEGPPPRA